MYDIHVLAVKPQGEYYKENIINSIKLNMPLFHKFQFLIYTTLETTTDNIILLRQNILQEQMQLKQILELDESHNRMASQAI